MLKHLYNSISSYLFPLNKVELRVEICGRDQYETVAQIARKWQQMGSERHQNDIESVSEHMIRCLKEESHQNTQCLLCLDQTHNVQAMAFITTQKEDKIQLNYLVSHPDNVPHQEGDKLPKVRGAGSTIVRYVIQKAQDEKLSTVFINATRRARSFYERFGFTSSADWSEDYADMTRQLQNA